MVWRRISGFCFCVSGGREYPFGAFCLSFAWCRERILCRERGSAQEEEGRGREMSFPFSFFFLVFARRRMCWLYDLMWVVCARGWGARWNGKVLFLPF